MGVKDFLNGERDKFVSLENAVDELASINNATDKEIASVLIRILNDDKLNIYINNRGNFFCQTDSYFDDVNFNSAIKELLDCEKNGNCPCLTFSDYFLSKSALVKALNKANINHTFGEREHSNIPELYKHYLEFGVGEANLIINNINPQDADNDWNYWQNPPPEVAIMDKIIEQHLDELELIDTGHHWTDKSTHKFKHSTWRTWCKRHGHKWNIPDVETQTAENLPTTDPELKQRAIDLQVELDRVKGENEALRVQLSDTQKTISELRLLSNATDATAPHYTHLMKIAIEVQRKYWKNLSIPPKQETLIVDIKSDYKHLTDYEARVVERIACPIDRKK